MTQCYPREGLLAAVVHDQARMLCIIGGTNIYRPSRNKGGVLRPLVLKTPFQPHLEKPEAVVRVREGADRSSSDPLP